MIIPAISAIAAVAAIVVDPTAIPPVIAAPAVLAIPAVPEQIIFGGFQNILFETYSADNLKIAMTNALITLGNDSFTLQQPQMIQEMTIANGLARTPTNLKPSDHGEVLQLT
jgi:hypothetical protein